MGPATRARSSRIISSGVAQQGRYGAGGPARTISPTQPNQDAILFLLPLLVVLSTFLFLLLVFLICVLFLKKRRGILLRDNNGPVDMSREALVEGEGGFEGVESRWLETVDEETQSTYHRAKDYQLQNPPNSLPTDITLSQFLAIQEKGVSAWMFEADFEVMQNVIVQSRTELTFLPDPSSATSVQSNLPLPKLNDVYYWEVKLFELPTTTEIAIGLATKPYPYFRLPGHSRFSVAYHSSGDKSHNYPFTHSTFGAPLKEGDVLGVGYRPRTGTVFYTRNGRKLEDAFTSLLRWNLFPTIGANGPCTLHVNLGQSGFVFIEANVKKWGLAPMVGTQAPPPAYGSERGSILLASGGIRPASPSEGSGPAGERRSHRSRRPRPVNSSGHIPSHPSPLRGPPLSPTPLTPPPPITPIDEEREGHSPGYISPTDLQGRDSFTSRLPSSPPPEVDSESDGSRSSSSSDGPRTGVELRITPPAAVSVSGSDSSDLDSPHQTPNPPTPNLSDIHMDTIPSGRNSPLIPTEGDQTPTPARARRASRRAHHSGRETNASRGLAAQGSQEPPGYSPLDAYAYSEGVHIDLPADIIAAALEGGPTTPDAEYEDSSRNLATSPPSRPQRSNSSQSSRWQRRT